MTEIYLRLSDLREAVARMQRTALQLDTVAVNIDQVVRELDLLGLDPLLLPSLAQVRAHRRSGETLRGLAARLSRAADDVEQAVEQPRLLPRFDLSLLPDSQSVRLEAAASSGAVPVFGGWYVSGANRPTYDALQQIESRMDATQARLSALSVQRTALISDLAALRNRLVSDNPAVDLGTVRPAVMMQQQIVQLDSEIAAVRADSVQLQAQADSLIERLRLVQPGTGADWALIRQMETAETPQYMLDNTYDCVQHVVSRVAIPDGIAIDAYQWHEAAARLPEYGITVGDVPLPGAVLQMDPQHSYADDVYGHVMVVEKVENGVVWVTDNLHPDTPVRLADITSETSGPHLRYLYLPWHTRS